MIRSDVAELHYIAPIGNVPSILQLGLLSNRKAAPLAARSVAMSAVQAKRAKKVVPGGRPLHDYVNLYFDARNPMMFLRKNMHEDLCVLRIAESVLDGPDVVITDGNAASDYAAFHPSPAGLGQLDKAMVFARDWRSQNPILAWQQKSAKCSEVLVPDRVPPPCVLGAYVSTIMAQGKLTAVAPGLAVSVLPDLFFQ